MTSKLFSQGPGDRSFSPDCTAEDLYYCFRLLLGRPPDEQEWSGHAHRIGKALPDVVADFLASQEFKSRDVLRAVESERRLVQLPDFELYVSPSDEIGAGIMRLRAYEPHVGAVLRSVLAPGMAFLDIGANVGYFSLLAAQAVGRAGRVFAVEPFARNLGLLLLNARCNGFDQLEILPFAASDRTQLLSLNTVGCNGRLVDPPADATALAVATLVAAVRLDDVLRDVARVDAVKIDVEGAEHRALLGARQLLERSRPTIVSEFSPPGLATVSGVDGETYLRFLLLDDGYQLQAFDQHGVAHHCGRDIAKVIALFEQSGVDHIDIVAQPSP